MTILAPILFVCGYFSGSIPFGLILTRLAGLGDIRKTGSGNIGATNVLRTGNKSLALATLILDISKAALPIAFVMIPVYTGKVVEKTELWYLMAIWFGFGAIIGHCYPVWLKFKGGKGVATTLGTLLAAVPFAGLIACATWLAMALVFRISSLSALVAVLAAPIAAYFIYGLMPAVIALLIAALVWWRHRDNILRLLKGEEPKIGDKKK